jgi:hypothetical protein
MKFYTYIKETIKNNVSPSKFNFFFKSWNLNQMIFKRSLVRYGMIMLMVKTFLS